MSKTGNDRIARMQTDDFKFGWESAERGEPYPEWSVHNDTQLHRIENQRFGWSEYHREQKDYRSMTDDA